MSLSGQYHDSHVSFIIFKSYNSPEKSECLLVPMSEERFKGEGRLTQSHLAREVTRFEHKSALFQNLFLLPHWNSLESCTTDTQHHF